MKITRVKNILYLFITLLVFCSCDHNTIQKIPGIVKLYNYKSTVLKDVELSVYKKEGFDKAPLAVYRGPTIKKAYDTLNHESYLWLNFKNSGDELLTKYDYILKLNDTLQFKIFNFSTTAVNQGSRLYYMLDDSFGEADRDGIISIVLPEKK